MKQKSFIHKMCPLLFFLSSQVFNSMLNRMLFIRQKVFHSHRGIWSFVYMQTCIRDSQKQPLEVFHGVLKNFAKFTGKYLCQSPFFKSVFFNSVYPSSSSNLENNGSLQLFLINRLWHRWFPVNFAKFLRTPFLQNTFGQHCQH